MKIFKYTFPKMGRQIIELPSGAEILSMQVQYDTPTIWCKVDPNASMNKRTFYLAVTAEDLPEQEMGGTLEYIGTGQMAGGAFVFHVFEET